MKTELEAKYPQLFSECYDFSIDEGWMPIVERLCEAIQPFVTSETRIVQVKQKFGGLRVYYHPMNDNIDSWISRAEHEASATCEICGKDSQIKTIGYVRTLCIPCADRSPLSYELNSQS